VPYRYNRFYIVKSGSFDQFLKEMDHKSRYNLLREVRLFKDLSNGQIKWREYGYPHEIDEFYDYARQISKKTYQERLLSHGFPDTEEFRDDLRRSSENNSVRGYVLFRNELPIAYAYIPIRNGRIMMYEFIGYDPEYKKWSAGTILQYLIIEKFFSDGEFEMFDFEEGEGAHKESLATDFRLCADIYFFKFTLKNSLLIFSHFLLGALSRFVVKAIELVGLKASVKRAIRKAHEHK
jgi:CelD/BcsL family acetyltransferase involved in cellulose biosynthesis